MKRLFLGTCLFLALTFPALAQTPIKQSSTQAPLRFLLVSSTDGTTPITGATATVTLAKGSSTSFSAASGSVTEIGNGVYQVAGNATDTSVLGPLSLHATGAGALPYDREFVVVAYDPQSAANLGLSNLDAPVSSRNSVTPPTATAIRNEMDSNSSKLAVLPASFPANFPSFALTSGGLVSLNLTQTLDLSNTGDTVGGSLLAGRAQGFGKWLITGTPGQVGSTLKLYAADATTVIRTFNLATAGSRQ